MLSAHHSAAYYPHAHQTLKSLEGRYKTKKKEIKYKKNKAARPSQLFQPSLQEVAEQVTYICCIVGSSESYASCLFKAPSACDEIKDGNSISYVEEFVFRMEQLLRARLAAGLQFNLI